MKFGLLMSSFEWTHLSPGHWKKMAQKQKTSATAPLMAKLKGFSWTKAGVVEKGFFGIKW